MNESGFRFVDEVEVFGAPPKEKKARNKRAQAWYSLFEKLLDHPGSWAEIAESTEEDGCSAIMVRIRKNCVTWLPNGEFEMRTKRVQLNPQRKGSKLYARFVAPADAPIVIKSARGPERKDA